MVDQASVLVSSPITETKCLKQSPQKVKCLFWLCRFSPQSGSSIAVAHMLRQHVTAGAGAEEVVHFMAAAKQRERAGSHYPPLEQAQ